MQNRRCEIAQSHIDGNVPADKDFAPFLKRDLAGYFNQRMGKQLTVEYEMLRDGPTQTGTGYPKFFAWIKVHENDKVLEEGAVVLAAMDRKAFSIIDYHEASSISAAPQTVRDSFPPAVAEVILEKLALHGPRGSPAGHPDPGLSGGQGYPGWLYVLLMVALVTPFAASFIQRLIRWRWCS